MRVVTHPKVFMKPSGITERSHSPISSATNRMRRRRARSSAWEIFRRLCVENGVKGNLVPDAYLAALAIESGANGSQPIETSAGSRVCGGVIPALFRTLHARPTVPRSVAPPTS